MPLFPTTTAVVFYFVQLYMYFIEIHVATCQHNNNFFDTCGKRESMVSSRITTVVLFFVLAAIWGLSFVAARAALRDISPVLLAAFRFDIAAFLMLSYAILTTSNWFPSTQDEWVTVLFGGILSIALHHTLLFIGQQHVTSAVAAIVMSLDPLIAAVFARFLLSQKQLSPLGGLGLLLGIAGVGLIGGLSPDAVSKTDIVGIVLIFFAAVAFALGAVVTQRLHSGFPVQSMQAWMMVVGAPLLHGTAFVLPGEELAAVTWSWTAIVGFGYLAIIAAGLGYFLYFELLNRVGAIEINLIAYATPIFAAVGGWVMLGEPIQPRSILGFGIIVIGFAIIKRNALRAALR